MMKNKNNYLFPEDYSPLPIKKIQNSSLRIAGIFSDRLYQGLRYEGDLLLLTPNRFNRVLRYGMPDFLLVESVTHSCDGAWFFFHEGEEDQSTELATAVNIAQSLSIPTVFWLTVGHEYVSWYKEFAILFDFIACADIESVAYFLSIGKKAFYLPPCIQPAIFNPLHNATSFESKKNNILFDKGLDTLLYPEINHIINDLEDITIFESRLDFINDSKSNYSELLYDNKIPIFSHPKRTHALKNSRIYATTYKSHCTPVEQQWMILEAAACRLPIIYLGRLEHTNFLYDIVITCASKEEYLLEFYRQKIDDLYRERLAHLSWRSVNKLHTFSHRIADICKKLDIEHNWVEYPKITITTPSYRRDLLDNCVTNYDNFNYPDKELILVYNGDNLPTKENLNIANRSDITVTYVPSDLFAGAALNLGHIVSSGKYIFRIDDDDYYGKNYILDMFFIARSVGAELFGKSPVPLIFEGNDSIYVKKDTKDLTIVNIDAIHEGKIWIGGNTVSGLTDFFNTNPYFDTAYGAADSSMQLNIPSSEQPIIVLADKFNAVAFRNNDINLHTWRHNAENLKKNRILYSNKSEYMI